MVYTAHKNKRRELKIDRNSIVPEMNFLDRKSIRHALFFLDDRVVYFAGHMREQLELFNSYKINYFIEDYCKLSIILQDGDRHFYVSVSRNEAPVAKWITQRQYDYLTKNNVVFTRLDRVKKFVGNARKSLQLH